MKKQLLLVFLFVVSLTTKGQNNGYWREITTNKNSIVTHKSVARQSFPSEYKLFQLNADALRNQMYAICDATEGSKKQSSTTITLPNAKGGLEEFEIYEASNFDTELQARFPEIRAFSGVSKIDGSILKIAISPINISSTIFRNDAPTEIIEQYSNDASIYSVYDRSKNSRGKLGWTCSTSDEHLTDNLDNTVSNLNTQKTNNGTLKVMRLAQSCNAEYANYFGATSAAQVANVLTAFNNTLTRCNGVYEKDLGLHLNLVNQTTNVIYYVAGSDPYTTDPCDGSGLGNWNTELQIALNTTLTGVGTPLATNNAAYDIGHMFGRCGGGGNAGCIGCPCVPGVTAGTGSTKGRGITSPADGIPLGDNFDIDYVVHEIGHQLGANHTFTISNETGTTTQMEVGSGITIMGYAGITSADLTNHSIDKYHATSISQIQADTDFVNCGTNTNISANNATPTVTITGTALTIPISTPFALDCTGTDANSGDVLTYSWEQMNEPTNAAQYANGTGSSATATKASGPNFLSWQASASTVRYFPKMTSLMNNALVTAQVNGDTGMQSEALLSIARTLNFRVTVRDNAPYSSTAPLKVGQTNFADMTVSTNTTGGAFTVSSQGTAGIVYTGGSTQTVTWTSAHTVAPFNVANVDILISYDSGATWTIILAGTANDGTQVVTMPNPATNQTNCRLMVRSAVTATQKSYFFDLNNNAFTLNRNLSTEVFEITNLELYPNPNRGNFNIKFDASSNNVKVLVHDIRGRQIFEKNYNNNGVFNQEINLENTLSGVYLVTVFDGNKKTTKRVVIE